MSDYNVKDKTAIIGLGETKYYKRGQAPIPEFRLACEAIIKAADDAGIDVRDIDGIFFIDSATPIFVHQYSHAWFDFRDRRDRYANYFHNSQRATVAHRLYCMDLSDKFPWYGPDMWGVTASDSRRGYRAWASPARFSV